MRSAKITLTGMSYSKRYALVCTRYTSFWFL